MPSSLMPQHLRSEQLLLSEAVKVIADKYSINDDEAVKHFYGWLCEEKITATAVCSVKSYSQKLPIKIEFWNKIDPNTEFPKMIKDNCWICSDTEFLNNIFINRRELNNLFEAPVSTSKMTDRQYISGVEAVSWIAFKSFVAIADYLARPKVNGIPRLDFASVNHTEITIPAQVAVNVMQAVVKTGKTLAELEELWPVWRREVSPTPVFGSRNDVDWTDEVFLASHSNFDDIKWSAETSGLSLEQLHAETVKEREDALAFIELIEAAEALLIKRALDANSSIEIHGIWQGEVALRPVPAGFLMRDSHSFNLKTNALRTHALLAETLHHIALGDCSKFHQEINVGWRDIKIRKADVLRLWPEQYVDGGLDPADKPDAFQPPIGLMTTGMAGAPTSKHLLQARMNDRHTNGILCETLSAEVSQLLAWLKLEHPTAPQPQKASTENTLRAKYKRLKAII